MLTEGCKRTHCPPIGTMALLLFIVLKEGMESHQLLINFFLLIFGHIFVGFDGEGYLTIF